MTRSPDRAVRNLGALKRTASTSRVLNLAAIEALHARAPDYREKPFFKSRALNGAVVLKHRLRVDERALMGETRPSATKIILPFVSAELHLGGRSLFVRQPGWVPLLADVLSEGPDGHRDVGVLQ